MGFEPTSRRFHPRIAPLNYLSDFAGLAIGAPTTRRVKVRAKNDVSTDVSVETLKQLGQIFPDSISSANCLRISEQRLGVKLPLGKLDIEKWEKARVGAHSGRKCSRQKSFGANYAKRLAMRSELASSGRAAGRDSNRGAHSKFCEKIGGALGASPFG